jgi:hypothetical protein
MERLGSSNFFTQSLKLAHLPLQVDRRDDVFPRFSFSS